MDLKIKNNFRIFVKFSYFVAMSVFLFSIFYFLLSTDKVLAAESSPTINLTYPWSEAESPAGLVARFYQIALGLVGAAALGVLIYGAILWTISAGAVATKQDAKEWISSALWGLVLLLGAYLILYTINPDLVKLKNPELEFLEIESPATPPATTPPTPPM